MASRIVVSALMHIAAAASAQSGKVIQKASVTIKPLIADSARPPELLHGCPLEGRATGVHRQESNRAKNRTTHPLPADIDSNATLARILAPGYDADRWSEARGASIVGYVVEVKRGSRETVNCAATDPPFMDTHIALVEDSTDLSGAGRLIVEVTPRWRAFEAERGQDWSTDTLHHNLLHHWVRVTGWLFWDYEHANAAEHTRTHAWTWRATAWEIHPVTEIKICSESPEKC